MKMCISFVTFLVLGVTLVQCELFVSSQRSQNAPYQPSGYRPRGRQFSLPDATTTPAYDTETVFSVDNSINADNVEPKNVNGRNQLLFARLSNPNPNSNRNRNPNADVEFVDNNLNNGDNAEQGLYYLYLPNGQLQKVVYSKEEDPIRMENKAILQYKIVEPINGPVYSFGDPSADLVQILN